ncbi:rhesus theta defensin-1/2 subunit B-like [Nycticebus coucang]|uniref:rhesus theta defensin-1/2 subunit B-like n=1 Tax=Nycticebus coucang TaxID=9470 RepID=UPI00234C5DD9|nr:rhesus theta defensin-1/2 subunit B-like [Nycticebus coucang]
MRTLGLLTALLLVALQAQAWPLQGEAEEALDQEQPGPQDEGLDISVTVNENFVLQDPVPARRMVCLCRASCRSGERIRGRCFRFLPLCCR